MHLHKSVHFSPWDEHPHFPFTHFVFLQLQEFISIEYSGAGSWSCVFNVMTHSVLEQDGDLLNCEEIGSSLLDKFLSRGDVGSTSSVWDPINKRNLRTFRAAAKTVQLKLKDKIVNLREERGLMMRLLVLAKTRADIKLDKMFKKHEFSVTPRSLFAPDGRPWKCLDESSFLNGKH